MIPQSVYVVGAPGTGKTTLMDSLVKEAGLAWEPDHQVHRETWVNPLFSCTRARAQNEMAMGVVLGKRREVYGGTDALARSATPHVLTWLQTEARDRGLPDLVMGEGVRLTSTGFLLALHALRPLSLLWLVAPEQLLEERRGAAFTPTYRKALASRARNVASACWMAGVPVFKVDTSWGGTPDQIARDFWAGELEQGCE